MKKNISAIDLFCGAGGLTWGLEKAGIDVRLGIDSDPACSYPYSTNNKALFLLKPIESVEASDLEKYFPKKNLRLLAGCAPCQTFSKYYQKAAHTDKRWRLLKEFSRLAHDLRPDFITMENVPGLKQKNIFTTFVRDLRKMKYHVSYDIVDCKEYGIPQLRQRLVLLASTHGPIKLLTPKEARTKHVKVSDAIGTLPPLKAGEINDNDPLHRSAELSELNQRRIKASRPGGTWRDWNKELVADCHKKSTGKTYPSVYGRMCWDDPAPTITTQFFGFGNGRFGHPEQDRAISLREGAILQSFPKKYKFVAPDESIHIKTLGRLIGNAVPPRLGFIIGKAIKKHIKDNYE